MSTGPDALRIRGINYDTGTVYAPGEDSRPDWSPALLQEHFATIRDDLHANAVSVFGSSPDRLVASARAGLEAGLGVWVQPRLPDAGPAATLAVLAEVADAVEPMRAEGGDVRLSIGCELTVFAAVLIPGRGFERRARRLRWMWPALPLFNLRLNRFLARAAATARDRFGGEITYAAGSWESVSWHRFDIVGLNAYRDGTNHRRYPTMLRLACRHGRPVVVTEFGCCSYLGADARGAEGDAVVDWYDPGGPVVVGDHPRDEGVQARYVGELLDIFGSTGVDGAFVFEYSEPHYPRHQDPRRDLDVASFGIVAVEVVDTRDGPHYVETPKAVFHEIASRYRGAGDC